MKVAPELAEPLVLRARRCLDMDAREGLAMLQALGPHAVSEVPRVLELTRLGQKSALRMFALDALCSIAPESQPVQDCLARLLDDYEMRSCALKWIIKLGPVAAPLAPNLEVLKLEKKREHELVLQALQSIQLSCRKKKGPGRASARLAGKI